MARITEDYISFETAKLLIKKGFDYNSEYDSYYTFGGIIVYFADRPQDLNIAPRVTLQMAMNKLAEILPLESADMRYGYIAPYDFSDRMYDGGYDDIPYPKDFLKKNPNFSENEYDGEYPCWSLTALLCVLPILERKGYQKNKPRLLYDVAINKWIADSHVYTTDAYDNPVDACYEMIVKLNELNLL